MRALASEGAQQSRRRRARLGRRLRREPPCIHYFHQVDDPHSYLAALKLDALRAAYKLQIQVHLVSAPAAAHQGDSGRFSDWTLSDARSIASYFGAKFPSEASLPGADAVANANAVLAAELERPSFADTARTLGDALFANRAIDSSQTSADAQAAVAEGDAKRSKLGHFLGAMFHFDGEWYWGLDRLHLLEQRLIDEGFAHDPDARVAPLPMPASATGLNASQLTLEYFPSLRSPYTAVGHARVLDLVERSGVSVELRPVMPMLMRGVTAPFDKQRWIISDAGREGRFWNAPLNRIVDPFGDPVRRAFALFPGAVKLGRGMPFVTAYLQAAWRDGVDITVEDGLRQVASNAALNWNELTAASQGEDWEALLTRNVTDMENAGLWGVPSFRVSGGDQTPFACWGQDRIWRVEDEIARRA